MDKEALDGIYLNGEPIIVHIEKTEEEEFKDGIRKAKNQTVGFYNRARRKPIKSRGIPEKKGVISTKVYNKREILKMTIEKEIKEAKTMKHAISMCMKALLSKGEEYTTMQLYQLFTDKGGKCSYDSFAAAVSAIHLALIRRGMVVRTGPGKYVIHNEELFSLTPQQVVDIANQRNSDIRNSREKKEHEVSSDNICIASQIKPEAKETTPQSIIPENKPEVEVKKIIERDEKFSFSFSFEGTREQFEMVLSKLKLS